MKPWVAKPRTCAIYTRKSSEEGLEQNFNSLDAQREACEAFIKSQAHEGWILHRTRYDDAGFSGGTMERPALKQLLADIRARKVNVIVTYKIDRLTRSLADFARIVEQLDAHEATFVSVTQQFNTTSSMGRLTLNVLLSFAQFEREVTGERIRDKIAASKRRGLWMGGVVPLGYEPNGRSLNIVAEEAQTVRHLFARYLELGSVDHLAAELCAANIRSRQTTSKRGRIYGGAPFSRGALYHLLSNPLYIGMIRHKKATYPGQHPAIIEQTIWDQVQHRLRMQSQRIRGRRTDTISTPLRGKLFDSQGHPMSPTYARKPGGSRYRYYASQAVLRQRNSTAIEVSRISADAIETQVLRILKEQGSQESPDDAFKRVRRVVLRSTEISVEIGTDQNSADVPVETTVVKVAIQVHRRGHDTQIFCARGKPLEAAPVPDATLVRALVRAHRWRNQLESGAARSVESISRIEHVNATYLTRVLSLAYLAPDLAEEIIQGNQPRLLMLKHVRKIDIPLDWTAQRAFFARYRA